MMDRTHPFPEFEPEVTVRPRPEAKLAEVLRTDLGSGFVPLEIGAEMKWAFYDWPERNLTNVQHTRVGGYAKFGGERLLAIYDVVIFGEDARTWSRGLYRWNDEALAPVLSEDEVPPEIGDSSIGEWDATPVPLRLGLGSRWQGHEVYRCGDEVRNEGVTCHRLVDGPFEVQVPAGAFLCLRENWWTLDPSGAGHELAEWYVTEAGRTIYFRRYNGPAWRNYDPLGEAGVPAREHEGVTWRLWYECLPETAL